MDKTNGFVLTENTVPDLGSGLVRYYYNEGDVFHSRDMLGKWYRHSTFEFSDTTASVV
jgi:hypothetical protein